MSANEKQIGGLHYKMKGIQCWDYIAANGIGYFEGNVIKYVSRWREKGGLSDLEKARHYLEKLIETEREIEAKRPSLKQQVESLKQWKEALTPAGAVVLCNCAATYRTEVAHAMECPLGKVKP